MVDFLNREPITRRVADRIRDGAHNRRTKFDEFVEKRTPRFEKRIAGEGVLIGAVTAAVATVVEDTVGIPFGASSDIVDTELVDNGVLYTVNVNAPFRKMAEARATIDSSTGFTSYLTDEIDIDGVEVQRTRIMRDTYQIDVLVEDDAEL